MYTLHGKKPPRGAKHRRSTGEKVSCFWALGPGELKQRNVYTAATEAVGMQWHELGLQEHQQDTAICEVLNELANAPVSFATLSLLSDLFSTNPSSVAIASRTIHGDHANTTGKAIHSRHLCPWSGRLTFASALARAIADHVVAPQLKELMRLSFA